MIRRLAVGGMAEVFLAVTTGEGGFKKHVAIKRILPHLSTENEFISMFLDEARTLAHFNHPNIVQIYELGRVKNAYFLAMEFVHGLTMFKILGLCAKKNRQLPLDIAAKIVSDTCDALHYAHSFEDASGVPLELVHRDVSAQNVMLSVEGVVKVLDFGIAKAVGNISRTRPSFLKGKAMYMSPEQIEQKEEIDRRSDVFSLGIMLYVFSTHKRPFRGQTEFELMMSIVNDSAADPRVHSPDIPEELVAIISRALNKDRSARYQTALDMRQDLEKFLFQRQAMIDNHVLSKFINELAPRKKKALGDPDRVPTRPISSPLDKQVPHEAIREVYDKPKESPILLKPKLAQEPILLKPKNATSPALGLTVVPAESEDLTVRESEPAGKLRETKVELIREIPTPQPDFLPFDEDFEPETPPEQASATAEPQENNVQIESLLQPLAVIPEERPFAQLSSRQRTPMMGVVVVVLLVVGGATALILYLNGAFEKEPEVTVSPKTSAVQKVEHDVSVPSKAVAAGADVRTEPVIKNDQGPAGSEPSRKPAGKARGKRRRPAREVNWALVPAKEPIIEEVSTDKEPEVKNPAAINWASASVPEPIIEEIKSDKPTIEAARQRRLKLEEPPEVDLPNEGRPAKVVKPPEPRTVAAKPIEPQPKASQPQVESDNPIYQPVAAIKKRRVIGVDPDYPKVARQARVEASLLVKIFISAAGKVTKTRFIKTHSIFEKHVDDTIKTWRFSPHLVDGRPVSTYTVYKFVFRTD
ncbi:MAG: TonB family protein [Deltaproteobacteria bacterium]|nr:TonB family protein [Deltaproteobacteria bacterium]